MATIHLHPNVANFIVHMDWRDAQGDVPGFSDELVRHYEAGDLIILKNAPFKIDFELLNQVTVPEGKRFQKLSDKFIVYPKLYKPEIARFMLENFAGRPLLYARFRHEVQRVSDDIRTFLRTVFRTYRILKTGVSWRFTETGPESLHVDYFNPKQDFDYLRLFINIDERPRVWTVSHQLDELIRRNFDKAKLAEIVDAPLHQVSLRMTTQVLKLLSFLPPEETDRHVIEFAQGDVWLCETRLNSHQIFSGRRMIATDFYVDPSTMLDPGRRVNTRIADLLAQLAAASGGAASASSGAAVH